MTKFLLGLAAVLLCALVAANGAAQDVFEWRDSNGVTHFADSAPPGQRGVIRLKSESSSDGNREVDQAPRRARNLETIHTRLRARRAYSLLPASAPMAKPPSSLLLDDGPTLAVPELDHALEGPSEEPERSSLRIGKSTFRPLKAHLGAPLRAHRGATSTTRHQVTSHREGLTLSDGRGSDRGSRTDRDSDRGSRREPRNDP